MVSGSASLAAYSAITVSLLWQSGLGAGERRSQPYGTALAACLAIGCGLSASSGLDSRLLLMQAIAPAAASDALTGEVCDGAWIPGFVGWLILAVTGVVSCPRPTELPTALISLSVACFIHLAGALGGADLPALILAWLFLGLSSLTQLIAYSCVLAAPASLAAGKRGVPFIPYIFGACVLTPGTL